MQQNNCDERRTNHQSDPSARHRVGIPSSDGQNHEPEGERGSNQENSEGRDTSRTIQSSEQGDTPLGKVLQRLELIEKEYFDYVENHQTRLETRLVESKEKQSAFKNAVAELKQEIFNLTVSQTEETQPTEKTQ